MIIKGLPKAITALKKLEDEIARRADALPKDICNHKDAALDEAYCEVGSAIDILKGIQLMSMEDFR